MKFSDFVTNLQLHSDPGLMCILELKTPFNSPATFQLCTHLLPASSLVLTPSYNNSKAVLPQDRWNLFYKNASSASPSCPLCFPPKSSE